MRGRATFDWQVQERESSERPSLAAEPDAPAPRAALERWMIWLAVLMLAVVLVYWGGYQLVNQAEENLAAVEDELHEAIVVQEVADFERRQARLARNSTPVPGASAPTVPVNLQAVVEGTTIQSYQLDGDLARAQLYVTTPTEPWHEEPYYVTRVFRDDPSGWALTSPVSHMWGERRSLETTYFHVEYGQRNADVVAAVVPDLDGLYLRLYRDLGLVPPRNTRMQLRIDVVGGTNFDVTDLRSSGATIIVPPPELLERPAGISDAAALREAIAFPLAVKVFDEAIERYIVPCNWYSVSMGIGLWQRWDGHWLPSRRYWNAQQELEAWLVREPTPSLEDLVSVPQDCWHRPPFFGRDLQVNGEYLPRPELAATFVSFAVEQHSRRIVPQLLRALVRHKEWTTLAPDVFDMEADELEAAWQEYLAAQRSAPSSD